MIAGSNAFPRRGDLKKALLCLAILLAGLCLSERPAPTAESGPSVPLEKKISLDLRDMDLVEILKFLAKKGNFNLFVSSGVQGKVSLYLDEVDIDDALSLILQTNNLAYRQQGEIVYIMTLQEYRGRYGEDFSEGRESRVMKLKYAAPSQIVRMIQPLKSPRGTIVVDEKTGDIILIDQPDKLAFMTKLITQFDAPPQTRVFDISYSKAADIRNIILQQADAKGIVSVQSDTRSNQVIVTAPSVRMDEIASLIGKIDRKTREVSIDTQIVKIVLNDDNRRGIDWQYLFRRGFLESLDLNVNLPQVPALTQFGSIGYGTIPNDNFNAVFSLIQSLGESKILASPRLTVVENDEAKILIGTREAYVTTTTTTTGVGVSNTAEAVSFLDVGISLRVAPVINKEGYVTMKIKPEVSSVGRVITTPSESEIPIIDTTQAETRVMVKDGATIVIGGLRKDEKSRRSNRIPFLSAIPVLGNLFKNSVDEMEQSELVVFLTPHILKDGEMEIDEKLRTLKPAQSYGIKPPPSSAVSAAASDAIAAPALKGLDFKGIEPYPGKG
jgi:type IV pilus assembly protein PilQ